jgi:hypothetical protein
VASILCMESVATPKQTSDSRVGKSSRLGPLGVDMDVWWMNRCILKPVRF